MGVLISCDQGVSIVFLVVYYEVDHDIFLAIFLADISKVYTSLISVFMTTLKSGIKLIRKIYKLSLYLGNHRLYFLTQTKRNPMSLLSLASSDTYNHDVA